MSNALLLIEKLRALGADSAFADDHAPWAIVTSGSSQFRYGS